jgi:hypothetical protein
MNQKERERETLRGGGAGRERNQELVKEADLCSNKEGL